MNEMNCKDCRLWLHGYLDNELDTKAATRIAEHLVSCAECKHHYEELKALTAGVKESTPYFEAPTSLNRSIFTAIQAQASREAGGGQIWSKLKDWAAPGFSLAALAAAVLLYVGAPASQNAWLDEAVSEHVRSLMAEHLNDVASSDRHTVKPWFIGKLDFSPPVYDFSAQGYPLLGGRLDYLQHQNVAALTYRHNKHIINMFILPTADEDRAPKNLTERGYNIVHWQQNHMRFIAVSDLNLSELQAFCELIKKGI